MRACPETLHHHLDFSRFVLSAKNCVTRKLLMNLPNDSLAPVTLDEINAIDELSDHVVRGLHLSHPFSEETDNLLRCYVAGLPSACEAAMLAPKDK